MQKNELKTYCLQVPVTVKGAQCKREVTPLKERIEINRIRVVI